MSVTLSNSNVFLKKQMNYPMKREFEEYSNEESKERNENFGDANSEASDVENNPNDETNTALDYTENALTFNPVADFIKKEFLPELNFTNPFRNQNLTFKDGFHNRSPFLLPTQLYKSFLATLSKRRRNVADCYSLYSRNMLFSNGFSLDTSDDENNLDRISNSPDEVSIYLLHWFYPKMISSVTKFSFI